jgi:hypothetical protein
LENLDPTLCPLCGGENNCRLCSAECDKDSCWCAKVNVPPALLEQVPSALKNQACICQPCVMKFHRLKNPFPPEKLLPGDFYLETNGTMVFTAAYHLRRGWCCGSGCRHCPYGK